MFREKIRGEMNVRGIGVNVLARQTHINRNTLSGFLCGSRALSNRNLDIVLDALGLTLVPKAHFDPSSLKPPKNDDENAASSKSAKSDF